jgi:hypothetical protein
MLLDSCLVDTNVLLRIPKRSDPYHLAVDRALSRDLRQTGFFRFDNITLVKQSGCIVGYGLMNRPHR